MTPPLDYDRRRKKEGHVEEGECRPGPFNLLLNTHTLHCGIALEIQLVYWSFQPEKELGI